MRLMDHTLQFSLLLTLLGFASILANASPMKNNFGHCERVVKKWAVSSLDPEVNEDKHTLRDLLFFLHVPRTGGRTYFHCFLRKLYSKSLECPRSYDKLRFDPRFLVHPNLTSATQMAERLRSKMRGVSTLDIWPWKYLVPWMREDLFARRDARRRRGSDDMQSNGAYDMEEIVMPLHEYINSPIALDIVHNGATFQVAGLTNNSYLEESHEVRHCVQKYEILGEHVLQVAKKRLDDMLYVGLTEEHRESATMFANVVGAQVISQWGALNMSMESVANNKSEQSSSFSISELENDDHQNSSIDHNSGQVTSTENDEATKQNMTVDRLMEAYEVCISSLRKEQAHRRTASLKRISPANFSKEGRLQVPGVILEQIRSLNRLDLELYKYAQDIFEKRHKHSMEKLFAILHILDWIT
ncbi:hypothetical protein CIPAW_14G081900 [Carya illinoinensis]|uniref:Sulfotransferase n=1 Tax=Carya illinoinensis TaxID=32201 RepID=A0A8T1NCH8_CARIL|nr:hypothetical protein CIPAW_14G081900 [Carya illinoinensis]KAG6629401.1 hypothetical protein CIPAW_14G081900 [Carya illinoinensis]